MFLDRVCSLACMSKVYFTDTSNNDYELPSLLKKKKPPIYELFDHPLYILTM